MAGLVIKQDQNLSKLFEEVTEYEVKKALNKIGDVVVDEMKARIAVYKCYYIFFVFNVFD